MRQSEYTDGTLISIGATSSSTDAERFMTASKDYVTAYATRGNIDGFTSSDNGYEGIFKTVIIAYKNSNYSVNENNNWVVKYSENDKTEKSPINIEGGTTEGGEPTVSGFPVRDATSDPRYSKNMYCDTSDYFYYWVSYEIVSDWAVLQHKTNYSSKYPKHSYGQLLYLYNYSTWE